MDEPSHATELEIEQKHVNRIYAAFAAMVIFLCVPSAVFSVIGILLLFYVMGNAYGLRKKYGEDSLVNNHMTYLIRSFWISSLFCLIGMIAAGIYIMETFDMNEFAASMTEAVAETMNTGQMVINGDMKKLIMVSIVTLGPSVVYLVYRVAKGVSRASKGYRIADVKGWF